MHASTASVDPSGAFTGGKEEEPAPPEVDAAAGGNEDAGIPGRDADARKRSSEL